MPKENTIEEKINEFDEKFSYIDVNECDYDDDGVPDNEVIIDKNGLTRRKLESVRYYFIQSLHDTRRQALEELEEIYRTAVMKHTDIETWDKIKKTIWELTKPV